MKFDIILHGKPNAGNHKATNGLDKAFCQNLVDGFFQSMGNIKENEILIVDARNWKGAWHSIYTFWLGGNITDTAGRGSYLAISVVVKDQYLCLVSAAYDVLHDACLEKLIGTYISKQGKYIVQNFDDNAAFENLVSFINSGFVNLGESFDNSFTSNANCALSICRYNLLDCDSKAFVEDWKRQGRVYVSNGYDSKDKRLSSTDSYYRGLQKANSELSSEKKRCNELEGKVKELEGKLTNGDSKVKEALASLRAKEEEWEDERKVQQAKISELAKTNESYRQNEKQIASLLGLKTGNNNISLNSKDESTKKKNLSRFIPLVNTLLLVILVFVTAFGSCGSQNENLKGKNNDNEQQDTIKIDSTTNVAVEAQEDSLRDVIDIDCGLTIFQENKPIDVAHINATKPLTITVSAKEGYKFYVSNLNAKIEIGKPFNLEKKDATKPIVISYRSEDMAKCNDKNVITIK